eukprot:EG_transcript_17849
MILIPVASLASYAGNRLAPGFWMYAAQCLIALAFSLVVRFTSKSYIFPIHAVFCIVLVALFGAMVSVQYRDWLQDAHALEPKTLSDDLNDLEVYLRQLLASHAIHVCMVWIASQWIVMAFTGMKPWTAMAYIVTLVTFCACNFTCPSATAMGLASITMLGTGGWMAFGAYSLILESVRRSYFLAQTQLARELHSSQQADSILNHTLKNILADVAANLEVFLSGTGEPTLLEDCIASLRRGMQSCKDRQTYLKLAAGEYQPTLSPVSLSSLATQLVAGRPIAVRAPDTVVPLDATLMALILENAISNAFHHGSPQNPDVQFVISEFLSSTGEAGP